MQITAVNLSMAQVRSKPGPRAQDVAGSLAPTAASQFVTRAAIVGSILTLRIHF